MPIVWLLAAPTAASDLEWVEVVREGDPVPGHPELEVEFLAENLWDSHLLAQRSIEGDEQGGIFRVGPGSPPELLVRNGGPAPGLPGETLEDIVGDPPRYLVDASGGIAFIGVVGEDDVLFAPDAQGQIAPRLRTGTSVAGLGDRIPIDLLQLRQLADDGRIAFEGLYDDPEAVYGYQWFEAIVDVAGSARLVLDCLGVGARSGLPSTIDGSSTWRPWATCRAARSSARSTTRPSPSPARRLPARARSLRSRCRPQDGVRLIPAISSSTALTAAVSCWPRPRANAAS